MSTTIGQVLTDLARALGNVGIEGAMREARLILSHVFNIPMSRMTLSLQENLSDADLQMLNDIVSDRLERRPLSHILGYRAFFKHEFHVSPDVLDPRPETETLVVAALAGPFHRVLDLGTGSGAILVSLLAERESAEGVGTDFSQAALKVAASNAEQIGVAGRCRFVLSDWFENIAGGFDLIVSNPPYITADEMTGLAPELSFEPRMALTDEGDGLSAYRVITAGAGEYLRPGGRLMVEIGWQQGKPVRRLFESAGFEDVRVLPDLEGRDRVIVGGRPG